jgi:hypothetical protein
LEVLLSEEDTTVVVVESGGTDDSPQETVEEIADAVDDAQDRNEAMIIGALVARVDALEVTVASMQSSVGLHDDLISLHNHSEFATTTELTECEDRLAGMIEQSVTVDEPVVEDSTDGDDSSSSEDEPPKSRANRRSIADMYYNHK